MPSLRASAVALLALAGSLALPFTARAADDPFEAFNRAMFAFNTAVVERVIDPTVETVGPWLPQPVVTGLGNVYSNLTEIEFILNNALSGDLPGTGTSVARFAVNSTVGIGGLFDVAGAAGLQRTERDFGESLCHTGLPPGPYLVLPLVGSASLYSAAALAGAVALEVYALSFISTVLAAADFIVIDIGGTASTLRYSTDVRTPDGEEVDDAYAVKRTEYQDYLATSCAPPLPGA
ncbi:VacJ protein [Azospirillum sp. RWY-5-1]|uniref:VacJ protein n=1 Tax=Azospirillum oleiclasticum TaxID=2735135 RepID=A0ABX2TJ37_9PROT|nr:MlaA family lipoprotein [Azospirillum oleiclasticum]NYZ17103.1 VacJ protein [Azospirillum oleiclasticum]NYZ24241.1 VacJ protein [Azospirillum oleiclasticum]